MNIDILKSLHNILIPYDNICPRNCDLCEEYETAIFLPNEDELIATSQEFLERFIKHEEGFYYVNMAIDCPFFRKQNDTSKCSIYSQRPIDCRIFPFYPLFNLEDNSYVLLRSQGYCPLSQKKLTMMENDVKTVIDVINKLTSKVWRETYNSLNLHHSKADANVKINKAAPVELHETNLISKRLLTPRFYSDGSGIDLGSHFRLTDLGWNLCEYIDNYEKAVENEKSNT